MITEVAPAKVNLYLHVGGLRRDRLHDLDSVFVFVDAGDVVTAEPAEDLSLKIIGPFAAPLLKEPPERNLVLRAARLLQAEAGVSAGAALILDKRLPIASGVGGGSADAAAALRALIRLWNVSIAEGRLARLAFRLGADVPACLDRRPVHVSGAGERIGRGPLLPPLWICLVNPNVAMSTGPIFRAFDKANPAPPAPIRPTVAGASYAEITRLLENSRNDLEPVAVSKAGVVKEAVARLAARPGSLGARMSGSGATVFGLFSSAGAALRAKMDATGMGWWSASGRVHAAPARVGGNVS